MSDGGVIGKLTRTLAERRDALSAWVGVNDAAVAEALAYEDFDAVTLDLQHGGLDFVGASQAILAVALAGKPTIARIPVGAFALASRLVDAGAAAIIAPMIDDAATARRFAEQVKFPPLGQRSWGPRAAQKLTGLEGPEYLHGANALTLAIAMIETREALAALDAILATPGIDGVFVGPNDLSIALSRGDAIAPDGAEVERARGARQVRRPVLSRRPPRQMGGRTRLRAALGVERPQPAARCGARRARRRALKPRREAARVRRGRAAAAAGRRRGRAAPRRSRSPGRRR
jgi:4-hydroxy-2-oxoheptanedioate aldolase